MAACIGSVVFSTRSRDQFLELVARDVQSSVSGPLSPIVMASIRTWVSRDLGQLDFGLLGRVAQAHHGHRVVAQVDAVLSS